MIYLGSATASQSVTPRITLKPTSDGAVEVRLARAVRCECGQRTTLFVLRDGKSRCVACDAEGRQ